MRKPRIKPPVGPVKAKKSLGQYIGREIGKKYRAVLHKPKRTLTSWKNYTNVSRYNPKKVVTSYGKNYYKNFTLPLARPYRQAKAIYKKAKRFLKPFLNYQKDYAKQLGKYQKKSKKYEQSWEKYRKHLQDKKNQRREIKENFKKFVKKEELKVGDWTTEGSGIAHAFDRWRDEKIDEMKNKWTKEQLFYVPRMDLEGYNAIQISPERIWAYYVGEAQEIFPTVEKFREFLDDYFSLGGFISKGVSSMILGKMEKVGTLKLIKEVEKYTKILAFLF